LAIGFVGVVPTSGPPPATSLCVYWYFGDALRGMIGVQYGTV